MFFADSAQHEVLPAFANRHAVTIWYYDTEERKLAVSSEQNERMNEAVKAGAMFGESIKE